MMTERKLNRLQGVDYSKDNLFVENRWYWLGEQYPYNVDVTVGTGRDLSLQCGPSVHRNGDLSLPRNDDVSGKNRDLCVQRGTPAQNDDPSMRKLA